MRPENRRPRRPHGGARRLPDLFVRKAFEQEHDDAPNPIGRGRGPSPPPWHRARSSLPASPARRADRGAWPRRRPLGRRTTRGAPGRLSGLASLDVAPASSRSRCGRELGSRRTLAHRPAVPPGGGLPRSGCLPATAFMPWSRRRRFDAVVPAPWACSRRPRRSSRARAVLQIDADAVTGNREDPACTGKVRGSDEAGGRVAAMARRTMGRLGRECPKRVGSL